MKTKFIFTILIRNALSKMEDTQHAILCFWTDKNNIPGNAHYVAITKNHDAGHTEKYKVFNDSNSDTDAKYRDSFNKILDGGAIITGIIIN